MSPKRIIIDDDLYDLLDQEATARGIPLTVVASEHLHAAVEHYTPARTAGERRPIRYEDATAPCARPRCSFPVCDCVTVISEGDEVHRPGCSCSLCYWGTKLSVWSDDGMREDLPPPRAAGDATDPSSVAGRSLLSARAALAAAAQLMHSPPPRRTFNEVYFANNYIPPPEGEGSQ